MSLIGQIFGCLIVAAIIGLAMGWLLRSFATSEKRQQLSEIAARLRGREHEMDSLHHELKVRTSAVQILEGKMIASEAALKDLQADLAGKTDRIASLQTELADKATYANAMARETETLRQALSHTESTLEQRAATYADMQAELEQAQDLMVSRDQEIATLKTWVDQLEIKDAEILKLRTRISDLEPSRDRLFAAEARLADEQHRFRKTLEERDGQVVRLQSACDDMRAELLHREEHFRTAEAQHQATMQEHEEQMQKLRVELVEVESLRRQIEVKQNALEQAEERRVMDVTEREEEIGALRRRLVEYRVAQQRGLGNKPADRTQESPPREKSISKPAHTAEDSKDDLKKIHGIGPVIERVLNRMGLSTFRQIAGWDRTDIERMADKLNTFPDRIVRDNWVEGAKKQHFLKYGEKL